ncbi:MAG: hypothetical protein C5B50_22310 [Verrucomicrobia bacterium]|nr:MAG: hypothetical protein C5B50_22310 [Verrucomicrobiota bacterium]
MFINPVMRQAGSNLRQNFCPLKFSREFYWGLSGGTTSMDLRNKIFGELWKASDALGKEGTQRH